MTAEKTIEPAEDSIPLRVVSMLMTLLCLTAACAYTQMPLFLSFIYLWFAVTGCYVSYFMRQLRPKWLVIGITVGLAIVILKFAQEISGQYHMNKLEGLTPFIHVLAGLLTLHTFDLRARSDINISTLIAMGLFACTAVLGRDLPFGGFVVGVIVLATVLLYFESVARTKAGEGAQHPPPSMAQDQPLRSTTGSALLPICALPALALFLFLNLPRVDSFFDLVAARFHSSPVHFSDSFLAGLGGGGLFGGDSHGSKGEGQDGSGGSGGQGGTGQNGAGKGAGEKAAGKKENPQNKNGAAPAASTNAQPKPDAKASANSKEQGKNKKAAGGTGNKPSPDNTKPGDNGGKGTGEKQETGPFGGGQANPKPKMVESDDLIFRDKKAVSHDNDIYMTVHSNRLVYLKRMVYDSYDGSRWRASLHGQPAICERLDGEWAELGGVPSLFLPANYRADEVEQEITCEIPLGQVVPAAYVPQKIDIGKEQISVDEYGVLRCKRGLPEDITYRVRSKIPDWDLNQLRQTKLSSADEARTRQNMPNCLQLPETIPPEVKQLTDKITEGESTWFSKAERICKYLRYHYKYSTAPYVEDKERDLVADFLFRKKEGACGEFSSAFVVMCRLAGIPARCVGGYSPGELNTRTGWREIRGKDGHAWGEIFEPSLGWVPFDATPTGTMPEQPKQENPILAAIKQTFQAASIAFEATQMDRQIGKGSEQAYEIRMREVSRRGARPSGPISPVNVDLTASSPADDLGSPGDERSGAGSASDRGGSKNADKRRSKNFSVSWQVVAFGLALIPFIYLLVKSILARFGAQGNNPRLVKGVKPATLLYLKLVEDLKRMKILRRPSDTPDELTQRFFEILDSGQTFHPELAGLFKEFIDIYSAERFSDRGYSPENYKQLREIGSKIHSLSRGRYTDKS